MALLYPNANSLKENFECLLEDESRHPVLRAWAAKQLLDMLERELDKISSR